MRRPGLGHRVLLSKLVLLSCPQVIKSCLHLTRRCSSPMVAISKQATRWYGFIKFSVVSGNQRRLYLRETAAGSDLTFKVRPRQGVAVSSQFYAFQWTRHMQAPEHRHCPSAGCQHSSSQIENKNAQPCASEQCIWFAHSFPHWIIP